MGTTSAHNLSLSLLESLLTGIRRTSLVASCPSNAYHREAISRSFDHGSCSVLGPMRVAEEKEEAGEEEEEEEEEEETRGEQDRLLSENELVRRCTQPTYRPTDPN